MTAALRRLVGEEALRSHIHPRGPWPTREPIPTEQKPVQNSNVSFTRDTALNLKKKKKKVHGDLEKAGAGTGAGVQTATPRPQDALRGWRPLSSRIS